MKQIFSVNSREIKYFSAVFFSFLFFNSNSFSQTYNFLIGIKINADYNFSRFDNNQYVSNVFQLRPSFTKPFDFAPPNYPLGALLNNVGIATIRAKVFKNIDAELCWLLYRGWWGYSYTLTDNYIGNKKLANKSTVRYGVGVPYVFNAYWFSKMNNRKFRKFVRVGGCLIVRPKKYGTDEWSGISTYYLSLSADPSKIDTLTIQTHTVIKPFTKATLLLGIGIEKVIWEKLFINLALVYNQGFSPIYTSDIEYTIRGEIFNNRILNKGTYLGIELNIGINPFYRKAKK